MDETTTFEPSAAEEPIELRVAVHECIQNIDLAREQITRDQVEIDQLQDETRAVLKRLHVLLPTA